MFFIPVRKAKHPAFYSMFLIRVLASFAFFVAPVSAFILMLFLDLVDFIPWSHVADLSHKEYEAVDKFTDSIVYFVMLMSALSSVYFIPLYLLFLFRLVGQYFFSKKVEEYLLIFFPNFFEFFWFWGLVLPRIVLPDNLIFLRSEYGLLLLFVIKLLQEFYAHLIGPRKVFIWTNNKFWKPLNSQTKY